LIAFQHANSDGIEKLLFIAAVKLLAAADGLAEGDPEMGEIRRCYCD
jgi:hypothetical protein